MNLCALLVEIQSGPFCVGTVQNVKPRARHVGTHLKSPNCGSTASCYTYDTGILILGVYTRAQLRIQACT